MKQRSPSIVLDFITACAAIFTLFQIFALSAITTYGPISTFSPISAVLLIIAELWITDFVNFYITITVKNYKSRYCAIFSDMFLNDGKETVDPHAIP